METIPIQNQYAYWSYLQPAVPPHLTSTYHLDMKLPALDVNISFNMANLYMINISAQDFQIWKYLGNNRSDMQLQYLTTIPLIPVHKIYQHLLNNTLPIIPFDTESTENTDSIWTLFAHWGIYISSYRITYTSRNRLILLLLLLVLTCQISVLTFTTR